MQPGNRLTDRQVLVKVKMIACIAFGCHAIFGFSSKKLRAAFMGFLISLSLRLP